MEKYFDPDAYEFLLKKVKSDKPDDLEILRDLVNDCLVYVRTVCEWENKLNTIAELGPELTVDYDAKRHSAHETAISSISVLNRMAEQNGIPVVFLGDISERHQAAAFCLEIADWLFVNRRMVLG